VKTIIYADFGDFAGLRGDPRFQAMPAAAEARLAAAKPADGAGAPESA
jgi:hypothetical protein